jgi:hypothetical protein
LCQPAETLSIGNGSRFVAADATCRHSISLDSDWLTAPSIADAKEGSMRTLKQVEDEIAALRAAIRMGWTERNLCTDLKQGRAIRLALGRRMFRLEILLKERGRLERQDEPSTSGH